MEVDTIVRNLVLTLNKTMSVIVEGKRGHTWEDRVGTVLSGMEETLMEVPIARKIFCMLETVV